jgi:lipoate-protein ligase A
MEFRLLRSQLTDPVENLALEERVFRSRTGTQAIVLLYQNAPCVVIGRNQNPWLECDVEWLADHGTPLLRRISGGGAVWHDLGNLNISFILPRKEYVPERYLDVVLAALHELGFAARRCERRSLWLGDRKIAGSAFSLAGQSAIIHACLLVHADLDRLRRALRPPQWDLQGRFLPSVPAHVRNLASQSADLTVSVAEEAILAACRQHLPVTGQKLERLTGPADMELVAKYRSWAWTYGRTTEFEHHLDDTVLHVRHARIQSATPAWLGDALADCPYERSAVAQALQRAPSVDGEHPLLRQIPPATILPARL